MATDRSQLREEIHKLYAAEHAALGEAGALRQLEQARQWDLAPTLRVGGVVVFPHAGVADCGPMLPLLTGLSPDERARVAPVARELLARDRAHVPSSLAA